MGENRTKSIGEKCTLEVKQQGEEMKEVKVGVKK